MSHAAPSGSRAFFLRWVFLSALGLATGVALGLGVAGPTEAVVGMMLVTPVTLALAGTVFGASQWVAVWKWDRAGLLWMAASAAALAIGMTLGIVAVEVAGRAITGGQLRLFTASPLERLVSLTAIGTVTGAALGVMQWLALRRLGISANLWIPRCTAAFGLGLPGGGLAADLLLGGLQGVPGLTMFLGVAGLTVGLITGRSAELLFADLRVRRAV